MQVTETHAKKNSSSWKPGFFFLPNPNTSSRQGVWGVQTDVTLGVTLGKQEGSCPGAKNSWGRRRPSPPPPEEEQLRHKSSDHQAPVSTHTCTNAHTHDHVHTRVCTNTCASTHVQSS